MAVEFSHGGHDAILELLLRLLGDGCAIAKSDQKVARCAAINRSIRKTACRMEVARNSANDWGRITNNSWPDRCF
jgi:hypothetical protein